MLRRFMELKDFMSDRDAGIKDIMLRVGERAKFEELIKELNNIKSVCKDLQREGMTLLDARNQFDEMMLDYNLGNYLAADADIVHCPTFERAVCKILQNKTLTKEKAKAVKPFKKPVQEAEEGGSYSERAKKKRRTTPTVLKDAYCLVDTIPPTSNVVERLFSQAKNICTDKRKALLPINFETILFLKINRPYWDLLTMTLIDLKYQIGQPLIGILCI